jgi:cyanophycinase
VPLRSPLLASALLALALLDGSIGEVAGTEEKLVLIGGGSRPPQALARFVEWAGGPDARILVVPWASEEQAANAEAFRSDVLPFRAAVEVAPFAPLTAEGRERFLSRLGGARGVFFTGGDQGRIMNVLAETPLKDALQAHYRKGIVFGGTSAGTAIMSPRMITGEGDFTVIDGTKVETRPGLGLLPGVILDQHFIKRQRENRLFGLVLLHPEELGVGVDEATALLVRGGRTAEVVGESPVVLVEALAGAAGLRVRLVAPGQRVDLLERRIE